MAGRIWWRFFWTAVTFGFGAGTAFFFRTQIFKWLLVPSGGLLSPFEGGLPIFTDPTGALQATFGVASKAGLAAAFPVALVSIYTLFRPVLPRRYRKVFVIFAPASYALFLGGMAFAYYVMMPVMLRFLLNFSEGVAVPLIDVNQYLDLLFAMAFWFGVVFQIPLFMFLLTKMEIMGYQRLRRSRRLVAIFTVIMAIVVTPTFDGLTMVMMAVPIYTVFEIGLFLSWLAKPQQGNYLFLRSIWTVITSPYRAANWAFRKVRRW